LYHNNEAEDKFINPLKKNGDMKIFEVRLLSFEDWTGEQSPYELALNGFYKAGNVVSCFHCGMNYEKTCLKCRSTCDFESVLEKHEKSACLFNTLCK
jgi:hypothetical protein